MVSQLDGFTLIIMQLRLSTPGQVKDGEKVDDPGLWCGNTDYHAISESLGMPHNVQ